MLVSSKTYKLWNCFDRIESMAQKISIRSMCHFTFTHVQIVITLHISRDIGTRKSSNNLYGKGLYDVRGQNQTKIKLFQIFKFIFCWNRKVQEKCCNSIRIFKILMSSYLILRRNITFSRQFNGFISMKIDILYWIAIYFISALLVEEVFISYVISRHEI